MNTSIPVILAGGKGVRFAPFVTDKLLWPFAGKSLLTRVLESVRAAELTSVIVVANEHNHEAISAIRIPGLEIQIATQTSAGGMAGALRSVKGIIGTRSILVLNGDDLIETTLIKAMSNYVTEHAPDVLLAGYESKNLLPVGYLKLESDKVVSVVEKPTIEHKPSNFVKLVADYFKNPSVLFDALDAGETNDSNDSQYEDALNLILSTKPANFIPYSGTWHKLKHPHFVLDVMQSILKNQESFIHESAIISPHAHVEAGVYVDAHAHIEAGAHIKGPSYIGPHVHIGNGALVRQSMVESHATVGFGSEVARSYVGPDSQIHHAFVGDSVLEGSVNMSWGSVTANLRLDNRPIRLKLTDGTMIETDHEKLGAMIARGAFLGVNTSTMPGVCIESDAKIQPGSILR